MPYHIISNARSGSTYLFHLIRKYMCLEQTFDEHNKDKFKEFFQKLSTFETHDNDINSLKNLTHEFVIMNHYAHIQTTFESFPDLAASFF